jgi:ParB-like chromosome segregation protein Spo0J
MGPSHSVSRGRRQPAAPTWRAVLPIHPAAELLPRMSDDELRELGVDIKSRGLQSPISIITGEDGVERLLDGINRLDAMEMAGAAIVVDGDINRDVVHVEAVNGNTDPYHYVLSANLLRRHLTADQKREVIEKLLKAKPGASNRTIAKQVKVDDKTVGKVRKKMEARAEIPHTKTRTDSKGREQPAKKSKPLKAEQKVFESPQEAHSEIEIPPEVEEEEKFEVLKLDFTMLLEWCENDSNWPPLNPGRRKRRSRALKKLRSAWSELVELAKPAPRRGRPPKAERAGAEA